MLKNPVAVITGATSGLRGTGISVNALNPVLSHNGFLE